MKSQSCKIIDFFLQRQNRLITGSIEGGFSIFKCLLQFIANSPTKCKDALAVLSDHGVGLNNMSLCNWICLNAHTCKYHQDNDASYSLICVPFNNPNNCTGYKSLRGEYEFEFCWDENFESKVKICLNPGVGIFFLGCICNHRQNVIKEGLFINYASYQNKRLYSSLICSIKRMLKINAPINT